MNTYDFTEIVPTLAPDGAMAAISFRVTATTDDGVTSASILASGLLDQPVAPAGEQFTDAELVAACDTVAGWENIRRTVDMLVMVKLTPVYAPPSPPVLSDAEVRALLVQQIDFTARDLYGQFTAFQLEYDPREAAARAYKANGYNGDATRWVTDFTDAAGMSVQAGVDRIIEQADILRAAIQTLAGLRMQKYAILGADTLDAARARCTQILADIKTLGASLP
jgi:hypothetical protein